MRLNPSKSSVSLRRFGGAIVVGYAGLMLGLALWRADGDMTPDSYGYWSFVRLVLDEGWDEAASARPIIMEYPPLLVLLMSALGKLGIDPEWGGRLLNCAALLLAAAGVWHCCRMLYRTASGALCAALLVMSLPGWYNYSIGILRDPLYWALLIWSAAWLAAAWRGKRAGAPWMFWRWCGLGVAMGLALLCRKEGLVLLAIVLAVIITEELRCNLPLGRRSALTRALGAACVTAVIATTLLWAVSTLAGTDPLLYYYRGFLEHGVER